MPRKKAMLSEGGLLRIDLSQALRATQATPSPDDFEDADAVYAAMEFSKQLLTFVPDLAQQAIQIQGFDKEADHIAAARRQVKLTGELFEQLQAVTMGTSS